MFKIKHILVLVFSLCIAGSISAQQKTVTSSWQFNSINNIGLLEGQTGSAFQLQSINGMQYKSWFAGVGLGLDFYRYRTIPLFLDIRKEFGGSTNKFFVYADGGVNFCWLTDNEKNIYLADDHYDVGFYTDLGMGYKIGIGRHNHLLLSIGYSKKKLKETYQAYFYSPPVDNLDKQQIDYNLNRLVIKIGWEF
jgi:hypothetical protein